MAKWLRKLFKKKKKTKENDWIMPVVPVDNVGRCTYYATDIYVINRKTVVGAFTSIGRHVQLGHGEHPLTYATTSPYFYFEELKWKTPQAVAHPEFWYTAPIHIGNDVWIGDRVFVKNGVTIGDGAVIGACAVVTKDIPPYAIAVGSPAKVIRYRFSPEIIEKLLRYAWWDLPDEVLHKMPYDDIHKTLAFLEDIHGIHTET